MEEELENLSIQEEHIWFKLPEKVKIRIFDLLDIKSKIRLSMISKKLEKEFSDSKEFVHQIIMKNNCVNVNFGRDKVVFEAAEDGKRRISFGRSQAEIDEQNGVIYAGCLKNSIKYWWRMARGSCKLLGIDIDTFPHDLIDFDSLERSGLAVRLDNQKVSLEKALELSEGELYLDGRDWKKEDFLEVIRKWRIGELGDELIDVKFALSEDSGFTIEELCEYSEGTSEEDNLFFLPEGSYNSFTIASSKHPQMMSLRISNDSNNPKLHLYTDGDPAMEFIERMNNPSSDVSSSYYDSSDETCHWKSGDEWEDYSD